MIWHVFLILCHWWMPLSDIFAWYFEQDKWMLESFLEALTLDFFQKCSLAVVVSSHCECCFPHSMAQSPGVIYSGCPLLWPATSLCLLCKHWEKRGCETSHTTPSFHGFLSRVWETCEVRSLKMHSHMWGEQNCPFFNMEAVKYT